MKGIGPTVMTRIYQSDNDKLTLFLAAKNAYSEYKLYRPDAIRGMIEENLRMRKRIKYLEYDIASQVSKNKDLGRKCIQLKGVHNK